jgi:hypothetical protein
MRWLWSVHLRAAPHLCVLSCSQRGQISRHRETKSGHFRPRTRKLELPAGRSKVVESTYLFHPCSSGMLLHPSNTLSLFHAHRKSAPCRVNDVVMLLSRPKDY